MIDEQDAGILSPGWAGADVGALDDRAWIDAALRVESALARCQAAFDIIPPDAAATIEAVAAELTVDSREIALTVRDTSNFAIGLVERLQRAVDDASPGTSDYVHLGATSQDILDSASMLVATESLLRLEVVLDTIRFHLAGLIHQHGHLPMAGRTVSQHAVPITFGVKLASWLNGIIDAELRVRSLIESGLPLSLAGASGTLAAYQAYGRQTDPQYDPFTLVDAVAEELGLKPHYQPWHTVRTPIAELGGCLAIVSGALGKIAADIHVMSRTELHEISQGYTESSGVSSSMPQKRNPVAAVLVLAAARQVPAHAMVLQQAMIAEDERSVGAWQSEWQPLREALRLVNGSAVNIADLLEGLEVHADQMFANLLRTGAAVVAERMNVALTPLLGKLAAKTLLRDVLLTGESPATMVRLLREALARHSIDTAALDLESLVDPVGYLGASESIAKRALARNDSMD